MIPGLIFSVILALTIFFIVFKIIWFKKSDKLSKGLTKGGVSNLDAKVISFLKFGESFCFEIYHKAKIVTVRHIPNGFFGVLFIAKNKLINRYYEIFSIRGNRVLIRNNKKSEFFRNMEVVKMNGNHPEVEKKSEI